MRCLSPMASQGLELPMRPSSQNTVDVSQGRVESRFVVPAVVVDPTPDVAVEHPGEVIQRLVAALMKRPASRRRRWIANDAAFDPAVRHSPATAVGTDLIYAAATKAGGAVVHGLNRTVEWRLASGSAPASP